jgi:hypothetical protein
MVDASSASARFDPFHRTRAPWHFVGRIVEGVRRTLKHHRGWLTGDGIANPLKMLGSGKTRHSPS